MNFSGDGVGISVFSSGFRSCCWSTEMIHYFREVFINLGFGDFCTSTLQLGFVRDFVFYSSIEGCCSFRLRWKLVTLVIFYSLDCMCNFFCWLCIKMPSDDSSLSVLPTARPTTSHFVFLEDDYTHPCYPFLCAFVWRIGVFTSFCTFWCHWVWELKTNYSCSFVC